jgi:hypothetical protein
MAIFGILVPDHDGQGGEYLLKVFQLPLEFHQ